MAAGTYGNGSDGAGGFTESAIRFKNTYDPLYGSWAGFSRSSVTDTNTAGWANQYAVYSPGAGVGGTGSYAIVYDDGPWAESDIVSFPAPALVRGVYLNNTTFAALDMLHGSAFSKKFGGASGSDQDWFKVTISGQDADGRETGHVDFYLADYRAASSTNDVLVHDWTWVDLSGLGSRVRSLHFALSSSDTGAWGMNTPAYFAMDGLEVVPQPAWITSGFDSPPLANGSLWNGSDGSGALHDGAVEFKNTYDSLYGSWAGFARSSVTDTNTAGWANQFAVYSPGTGVGGTGSYAIVYDDGPWAESDIVTFGFPALVRGVYLNNTTFAALDMLHGSAFSKKFGGASGLEADWFKVTISGQDADGQETGQVDFYLADYRADASTNDVLIRDWTWVDLSGLGPRVRSLHFALSSSDTGAWGMNTPAYFAMDGLTYVYSFSAATNSENAYGPAIPGFVGPDGDGVSEGANTVNGAFGAWAARVSAYVPSPGVASQWTDPLRATGPVTASNFDVVSLGDLSATQISNHVAPGSITLGFDVPISDGPGADFVVFENGYLAGDRVFGELGTVDVSSDGTNFVRFPCVSLTPGPVGSYGDLDAALVHNLAGKHVNAFGTSWGTPFDLADLGSQAAVTSGSVRLADIRYVRIVDIPGSGDRWDDMEPSNRIYDAWVTWGSGGVDLEAVGVMNSTGFRKVAVDVSGPGLVTPCGRPAGVVSVQTGTNVTFSVVPHSGYHVVDVAVDGCSIGPALQVALTNVTENHRVSARFGSRLVIATEHAAASPGAGEHYGFGAMTVSVADRQAQGATQYICVGWSGSGSVPAVGATNRVELVLTNDSAIAWLWATNYWLDVAAIGEGHVDAEPGWRAAGSIAPVAATPDPWYLFRGWSGDTAGDTQALSMAVAMDRGRVLRASFGADCATNGVPIPWLDFYGLAGASPDDGAMSDDDHDGVLAWAEFFAGTDPGTNRSAFRVLGAGHENGSNWVTWVSGTNGSRKPFVVMMSTNLAAGWVPASGAVGRVPGGTNTWWSGGGGGHALYRVEIAP